MYWSWAIPGNQFPLQMWVYSTHLSLPRPFHMLEYPHFYAHAITTRFIFLAVLHSNISLANQKILNSFAYFSVTWKIHISKVSFFTKFTFLKSHSWPNSHFWPNSRSYFSQNSHFWNLIYTKFTFLNSQFLPNSPSYFSQLVLFGPRFLLLAKNFRGFESF